MGMLFGFPFDNYEIEITSSIFNLMSLLAVESGLNSGTTIRCSYPCLADQCTHQLTAPWAIHHSPSLSSRSHSASFSSSPAAEPQHDVFTFVLTCHTKSIDDQYVAHAHTSYFQMQHWPCALFCKQDYSWAAADVQLCAWNVAYIANCCAYIYKT